VKKLLERLLIFLIGVPLFAALVLFLPQKNHLALNLVVILLSALGSAELADMLNKKKLPINRWEALILGGLLPAIETIRVSFFTADSRLEELSGVFTVRANAPGLDISILILEAILAWILISRIFVPQNKLDDGLARIASGITVASYPGLFLLPLIRMSSLHRAEPVLLVFLLIVFGNDSAAWAAGMLFGKNNRGVIPASPNKSVAGFIGGFAASLAVGILAVRFAPASFKCSSPLLSGAILGLLTGAAAALGDLAESVMKRSAGVKDSGNIIPGRGGVLDSLDSVAFAAPIFYGLYRLLFM
jgi:phosphatidate cytidylyltransferase